MSLTCLSVWAPWCLSFGKGRFQASVTPGEKRTAVSLAPGPRVLAALFSDFKSFCCFCCFESFYSVICKNQHMKLFLK